MGCLNPTSFVGRLSACPLQQYRSCNRAHQQSLRRSRSTLVPTVPTQPSYQSCQIGGIHNMSHPFRHPTNSLVLSGRTPGRRTPDEVVPSLRSRLFVVQPHSSNICRVASSEGTLFGLTGLLRCDCDSRFCVLAKQSCVLVKRSRNVVDTGQYTAGEQRIGRPA